MKRQLFSLPIGVFALVGASAFAVTTPVTTPVPPGPAPINLTQACSQGGTRAINGSFDTVSGAVNITVTLTGCAGRPGNMPVLLTPPSTPPVTPGIAPAPASTASQPSTPIAGGTTGVPTDSHEHEGTSAATETRHGGTSRPSDVGLATHDGTVTVKGTFLLNTSGLITVNLVDQINTKVTFDASANTMTRVCTITRVGNLEAKHDLFHGTVTHNNCTMTGDYHESFGLVEHLLRNVTDTHGL